MTDTDAELKQRFLKEFGLTRRSGRRCLSRVGGQSCTMNRKESAGKCDGCGFSRRVFDHVSMWTHSGGCHVLVSQPYDVDVAAAQRLAEKYGVALLVSDKWSWHAPGSTTLLAFGHPSVLKLGGA